ncbi:MAG: ABC transporter ATP-binding protein [Pseudomonadota bacterium]
MRSMPIEMTALCKSFGTVEALRDVTLQLGQGEMLGLIGHNGAGKSTLFKLMLGLMTASSGSLRICGVATDGPGFRQVRRRIGYLPENFVTYDNLSGLEVLHLFADLKQVPRTGCSALLERVGLAEAATRRVRTYSKGMRQRLGYAQVLLGDPDLIFLDEPTNGLDPQGIADFYAILRELQGRGATIVITSHILAEIEQRVDRLAVMNCGQLVASGTLAQLRAQQLLPSVIGLTLRAGHGERLRGALAHLPGLVLHFGPESASIDCRAEQKMAVLAALDGDVLDVTVAEPSLEDVFLGYGGKHVQAA